MANLDATSKIEIAIALIQKDQLGSPASRQQAISILRIILGELNAKKISEADALRSVNEVLVILGVGKGTTAPVQRGGW